MIGFGKGHRAIGTRMADGRKAHSWLHGMRGSMSAAALALLAFALPCGQAGAAETTVRAAVLKTGTVNWELDTIQRAGLDKANGFELTLQPYADNGATRVALEGGQADVMVADWLWVAVQRAAGKDYVFLPYSTAVGSIVVPKDSPAKSLSDLKGKKIGIAGGPLDKSWLILRAYAKKEYGMDLAGETEQVYGAPPLIFKSALDGETDAAINFWHFLAKMKAAGMRELVSVGTASVALGLDPEIPLLGYVFKESYLADHPDVLKGFYQASRGAKELLASDDSAWEALRPMMNAKTDAEFTQLKTDYLAGVPKAGPVNEDGAATFFKLMADYGGEKLVGDTGALPAGLFAKIE